MDRFEAEEFAICSDDARTHCRSTTQSRISYSSSGSLFDTSWHNRRGISLTLAITQISLSTNYDLKGGPGMRPWKLKFRLAAQPRYTLKQSGVLRSSIAQKDGCFDSKQNRLMRFAMLYRTSKVPMSRLFELKHPSLLNPAISTEPASESRST